jgi:hypothetical protein
MTGVRTPRTDVAAAAEQAYVFAYPLVLMERTRARMTAVAAPSPDTMQAPVNRIVHARTIRRQPAGSAAPPNPDTLLSAAWLDLRAGPVALTVPETHGRYFGVSMIDMWTDVFASVGARCTGTTGATFAIAGPRWNGGALPDGAPITAPTNVVQLVGHTQTDDDCDAGAHGVQDGYRLRPLPGPWRTSVSSLAAPPPAAGGTPAEEVDALDPRRFFSEVRRLMAINPPHAADRPTVELMREAGLLDPWNELDAGARDAVAVGVQHGAQLIRAEAESPPDETVGHWRFYYELGHFGTDYLRRAAAARCGLAADPATDELPALISTDADGRPLSGSHRYVLRFLPGTPPPVNGFWSLTAYGEEERSAREWRSIGDRHGLAVDLDGSLPIHIQHDRPPRESESNWLPAPPDVFNVVLRLYWPRGEVLVRDWEPPALTRLNA